LRGAKGLFFCVVDLDPVAIGVLEVNLLNAVNSFGHGSFFPGPVFVGYLVLFQRFNESGNGSHGEAEVVMFIRTGFGSGAFDQVQVGLWADAEPGMFAIVEGFGDGIESDHLLVKISTGFQINHMVGNMVDHGFGLGLETGAGGHEAGYQEEGDCSHALEFEWEGNG